MLLDLFSLAFKASLLLAHATGLGVALLSVVKGLSSGVALINNRALYAFFAISLGLALQIFALFILAAAGCLNGAAIVFVAGLMWCLAVYELWRNRHSIDGFTAPPWDFLALLTTLLFFLLVLLVSYHAPGVWDDTMYQLPLARHYLEQQSLTLHEYVRFGLFPQNINLLMVLGLLCGGDTLAQLFCTVPLFVIALGLMGVSQHLSGHWVWGAMTGLLLFIIQPVRGTLGYAYVDNGVALFCFSAALAMAYWYENQRQTQAFSWILVSAILAGTAAGSKLFGGVLAALLGVCLLFSSREIKTVFWFSVVTLITGIGWYLRSFIISGDPVHPAGGPYFGYFLWDAADLASQYREQKSFGVSRNLLYLPLSLWTAGVIVWGLVFVGLFFKQVPRLVRALQVVFSLYFLFWFYVSQVDRYLSPLYGIGMALSAYTLYRSYSFLEKHLPILTLFKRPVVIILSGVIASLMLVAGVLYQYKDRDLAGALERRVGYLFNNDHVEPPNNRPGVELFVAADKHTEEYGSRLMQLGFENAVYFFSGVTIGDWYGLGRYRDRVTRTKDGTVPLPAEQMKQQMQYFNSRMLAVSMIRYPSFNPDTYSTEFKILARDKYGVLFVLKEDLGVNQLREDLNPSR